jgi:hypothetical protein
MRYFSERMLFYQGGDQAFPGRRKIFLKITRNLGFRASTLSLYTQAKPKILSILFNSVYIHI